MREFLSRNGIEFEERNVAGSARWREELLARRGEVVVPVLLARNREVVGFDEQKMIQVLGLSPEQQAPEWDGLALPEQPGVGPKAAPAELAAQLRHLLRRIQKEMEYNSSKGSSPYRHGQHDGMRFARDGLRRILDGSYEEEEMVIERAPRRED